MFLTNDCDRMVSNEIENYVLSEVGSQLAGKMTVKPEK